MLLIRKVDLNSFQISCLNGWETVIFSSVIGVSFNNVVAFSPLLYRYRKYNRFYDILEL